MNLRTTGPSESYTFELMDLRTSEPWPSNHMQASQTGMQYIKLQKRIVFRWRTKERSTEKAALLAIQDFQSRITTKHEFVQSDNKIVVSCINNMGSTKFKKVIDHANQIMQWCFEWEITLTGNIYHTYFTQRQIRKVAISGTQALEITLRNDHLSNKNEEHMFNISFCRQYRFQA